MELEKALYIFLAVYFVAVLGIVVDFRINSQPTFWVFLTLVWTVDGLGCIVMGIAVLKRHVSLLFDRDSLVPLLAGLSGVLLGLVSTYILVEALYKLVRLLRHISPLLESSP